MQRNDSSHFERDSKKLIAPSLLAAEADGATPSKFGIFLVEVFSSFFPISLSSPSKSKSFHFLVDTGSSLSILPDRFQADNTSSITLRAANGALIHTKGTKFLKFTLPNISKTFEWHFHVANVTHAILGADFLGTNKLIVDCNTKSVAEPFPNITALESTTSVTQRFPHLGISSYESFIKILLSKFSNTVKKSNKKSNRNYFHNISVTPSLPLRERVRHLAPEKIEYVRKEFMSLLEAGIIRRSSSPWASPLHLVSKKDGSFRPCGDYRRLNKITIHDSYPMPLINDVLQRMSGATIFSTLDLKKAYHQIPVLEADIPKTAVITPLGLFEYTHMPFGLRNAAQTFQRYIDQLLSPLTFVIAYVDDIIIGSTDAITHKSHLEELFNILHDQNLQINTDKCFFFEDEVRFLGHLVSSKGVRPLPHRAEIISKFPLPKTVSQLRSFLGTINYCHRFIPNTSQILAPMTTLCTGPKHCEINWTEDAIHSFELAKEALTKMETLCFLKPNLPLTLTTDASNMAIGAVLHQINGDVSEPLEFFSKKLNTAQQRYSTFDRELMAIHKSIKHFRHILEGRQFTILTDHKPLIYILEMKDPSPRQQRQISYISEFSCTLKHIAGKENIIADCLSRSYSCVITQDALFSKEDLISSPPSIKEIEAFGTKHTVKDGVHYDTSISGTFRPILGSTLRFKAFHAIHSLHHPGSSATYQILRTNVVWPSMRHDIKLWVSQCLECQRHKISRHTRPPIIHFPTGNRFDTLHVDLVGPLPPDRGYSYLLTMLDRKTRWFEVIPLKSISADIVASSLVNNWISRYGVPKAIITDRGTQFESDLFKNLSEKLGINHLRTTAYHPQTNGMLERFHRTLKTSLRILSTSHSWTKVLPFVLLGWRNTPSKTTGSSPAQLLFGTPVSLPNTLVDFEKEPTFEELDAAREHFLSLDSNPQFTASHSYKPYVPRTFSQASHVWIRNIVDVGLKPRYRGPYRLLEIKDNNAKVEINGSTEILNLARLKPAFGVTIGNLPIDEDTTENTTRPLNDHIQTNRLNVYYPKDHDNDDQSNISQSPATDCTSDEPHSVTNDENTENIQNEQPNIDQHPRNSVSKKVTIHKWARVRQIGQDPNSPTRLVRIH